MDTLETQTVLSKSYLKSSGTPKKVHTPGLCLNGRRNCKVEGLLKTTDVSRNVFIQRCVLWGCMIIHFVKNSSKNAVTLQHRTAQHQALHNYYYYNEYFKQLTCIHVVCVRGIFLTFSDSCLSDLTVHTLLMNTVNPNSPSSPPEGLKSNFF